MSRTIELFYNRISPRRNDYLKLICDGNSSSGYRLRKCQQTEKVVKEAVAEAGVSAETEKVTDMMKIAGYGVFGTPAVVINGEVKSVGKIPKKDDVKKWLAAAKYNRKVSLKNQLIKEGRMHLGSVVISR